MTTINVVGAYGKRYNNIVSATDAWDRGKDFKIVGGPYINKSDWAKYSKEDTVVYQGDSSIWVLEESKPLDYWDKQEKVEEVVKGFKKVQENA
jgi:hypothetical protein